MGPSFFLPFEEGTGNRLDLAGGTTLAEIGGSIAYAAGPDGGGVQITRSQGRYLACADTTKYSPGDTDFTLLVPVWLDTLPSGDAIVCSKSATPAGSREFQLYRRNTNNRWTFLVSSTGSNSVLVDESVTVAATGAWVWLAAWHNSVLDTINLQVNNGTIRTVAHTLGIFQGGLRFCVGNVDGGAVLFDGKIGRLLYIPRVLSAGERSWWYNPGGGRTGFRQNLVQARATLVQPRAAAA